MKTFIETMTFRTDGALVRTRKPSEKNMEPDKEVEALADLMFGRGAYAWYEEGFGIPPYVIGENDFKEEVHILHTEFCEQIPVFTGTFVLGGSNG